MRYGVDVYVEGKWIPLVTGSRELSFEAHSKVIRGPLPARRVFELDDGRRVPVDATA